MSYLDRRAAGKSSSRLPRWAWGVAASAFLMSSCGPSAEAPGADEVPVWTLSADPDLMLGEQDGDPDYLFERIAGVRLLPDGQVAVADQGYATVRVYDLSGALRARMGGEGEGPGEVRWLQHLALIEPDTLLVYDGDLGRITRFLANGQLVGTRAIQAQDGRPEVYIGTYSNGDAAIAWIASAGRSETEAVPDQMHVDRFSTDGDFVARVGEALGMRRMTQGPVPFSPFMHGFLVEDSLVHTDGREGSLYVVGSEGTTSRRIDVAMSVVDGSAAWDLLTAELVERDQSQMLDGIPDAARAEPIPRIAEVFLDGSDRFWLKHYDPRVDSHLVGGGMGARGGRWTVVDRGGAVVAEAHLPDGFIPLDHRDDLLAGIERDDLGVERVVVRRIEGTR